MNLFFVNCSKRRKDFRECSDAVVVLKLTFLRQVLSGRQYKFLLSNAKANDLTHFVTLDSFYTP